MNPDNPYQPRPLTPLQPQGRSVVPPSRLASQQQATANIIRGQLENIYQGKGEENTPQTTPVATPQATPISTPQPEIPQGANEQPTGGEKVQIFVSPSVSASRCHLPLRGRQGETVPHASGIAHWLGTTA